MWLYGPFQESLSVGPSHLFESSVNSSHYYDVFGGDAEVQQVDLLLSVCDRVNEDVITVGCDALRGSSFVL